MEEKKIPAPNGIKDSLPELPHKVPTSNHTISVLTLEKLHDAMAALTKAWVGIEPLAMWLKTASKDVYSYFLESQIKLLETEPVLTMIATGPTDQVVGVALNRAFDLDVNVHCTHPVVEALIKYLELSYRDHYMEKQRKGKVFCVDSLGVIDEAKGGGLGTYLVECSLIAAKQLGFKWCIVEATNVYSARICEKLGMERVVSVKYDEFEYTNPDGTKVKALAGLDQKFTECLNKKRPKDRPLASAASECILFEGEVDAMISKSSFSFHK